MRLTYCLCNEWCEDLLWGKVEWSSYRPGVAQKVGRGILYSFLTTTLEGGEWSAARPGRTLTPGKTQYPFYRRLGGPQGRSGLTENLVPTGILSRTVQPVVSHYTHWATQVPVILVTFQRNWILSMYFRKISKFFLCSNVRASCNMCQ